MHIVYIKYAMHILSKFSVYEIYNYLIYMVYAWYISCISQVYTLYITTLTYPALSPVTSLPIMIEQLLLLCFQLSANLLFFSEREHLVSILQLIPGTPAGCALCCGTHGCSGHLITVHR
jgi:hypothetical protein